MATVELDNVRKVYPNGFVAVAGATFAAADGELLVLVGPSGCGKSTTLRMIAGLESVTSGTLSIGDRVVNDVAPKDRDIAMVFQSYALYPHMSVAENLAFGLKLRGVERGEIARRVAEAAQMLGLDELLERQPRALSGGQRQRVALGRALVRQPKVFLLDEPLSNLDAKLRLSMRVEIARLHRRLRTTMIYVTHDQIEAMTLGQRIVVFNKGAIQQIDTPMNLYTRPENLFVAGFLGSPAMNFFRGTLAADSGLRLVGAGAELPLGADAALERRLRPHAGRKLVVGLRPEDLRPLVDGAARAPASIDAQLDVIEPVGNEVFLNLSCGGTPLVVRTQLGRSPADSRDGMETPLRELPAPGAHIRLGYEPGAAHFFDARSEQRIG